jgi:hypothetical protein
MEERFHDLLHRLDLFPARCRELGNGIRLAVAIAELDPEMALTRARKVLDHLVRQVYGYRVGEPAGSRPLENLLQRLVKDGHLPRRLAAYANAVRELGNIGTHFEEPVTLADVAFSLSLLMVIVKWYAEESNVGGATPDCSPVRRKGRRRAQAPVLPPRRVGPGSGPQ